jgi:hypothetical protein
MTDNTVVRHDDEPSPPLKPPPRKLLVPIETGTLEKLAAAMEAVVTRMDQTKENVMPETPADKTPPPAPPAPEAKTDNNGAIDPQKLMDTLAQLAQVVGHHGDLLDKLIAAR